MSSKVQGNSSIDGTLPLKEQFPLKSNVSGTVHSAAETSLATTTGEIREMMAIWPDLVRDLTEADCFLDIPDVTRWMAKVLHYNVPNGKKTRGVSLVQAYRMLAPPNELTEENLRLARILGWCTELCQAFLLVADDIVDRGTIRRGQNCWYLYEDIGLAAINDSLLLEQAIYQLLRIHFKGKKSYLDLMETFHEITMKTSMGQTLDTHFGLKPNLNFTMDRYKAITKYKTGYYTFVLPVTLAMYFAGVTDTEMHGQARKILLEMGHFFQVQDDYLDCYGDSSVSGKIGTDIQEGKCSWPAVVALQRATPAQRELFEECYGVDDVEKIAKIKQLYDDLGLRTIYSVYEEESYNLINTHIQQISCGLPHDLFFKLLSKIYRRVA